MTRANRTLLLISATLSIIGCAEKPEGYYEDEDGFSLIIPAGWNHEAEADPASVVLWRGERDTSSPTITIVTTPTLPPEATDENFADLSFRDAATIPGYTPMRSETLSIDGDTLTALVYAHGDAAAGWRQSMLVAAVSDDDDERKGYTIICSSPPGRFEGDKEEYRKVLANFAIDD